MGYTGAPMAGFTGSPLIGDRPLTVQFTDLSTGIFDTSTGVDWLWTFGDGETGALQNPSHTYYGVDHYDVELKVSTDFGTDSETKTDYITVYEEITHTESSYIQMPAASIKTVNAFTCVGWIANPAVEDGDSIVPLAIANTSNVVADVDSSIKFEISKEGDDYRLEFMGSKSKLIRSVTNIDLGDLSWHMVGYLCDANGNMTYYVDGQSVAPEDGTGSDGIAYSVAHSRSTRLGGGYVWAPYLDTAGQGISLYNWRYKSGFTIHQQWIRDLMAVDLEYLEA